MSRQPTAEQQACINAIMSKVPMLKVEACAGSGKTSTLTMMAEADAVPSLYLAFNKVTAEEAAQKFPKHVTCKTTHSIAYSMFGAKLRNKLNRPTGRYVNVAGTGLEIARFFDINSFETSDGICVPSGFIGLMVKEAVARFEQSADPALTSRHVYSSELVKKLGEENKHWVAHINDIVLKAAKKLWKARIDLNSPVLATHDTYLKQYQLSEPVMQGYEVLYVDEFQDTTPCVLDIVQRQAKHMRVVVVGDARQAIYGWRGAINAMQTINCQTHFLTKSFRYGQAVADIATTVLEGEMQIKGHEPIQSLAGRQDLIDESKPYTRLFRTNSALLTAAVEEITRGTAVSIEIDVKDFVKLLQSAIALFRGDLKGVKHDKILPYKEWEELIAEVKSDPELNRISKIVSEGKADRWIDILSAHVNSKKPMVTFTTAHKSKGREWDQVRIESDFKSCYGEEGWTGLMTEEQNLLYVAVTRAIKVLEYNHTAQEYIDREKGVKELYSDFVRQNLKDVEWKEVA